MKFYSYTAKITKLLICCLFLPNYFLSSLNFNSINTVEKSQHVAVLGAGYVGLISSVGLAQIGHTVVCADLISKKITLLNQGLLPIYEPGLEELIKENCRAGKLSFTTDIGKAIHDADVIIIAVGTPMSDDGNADLSALMSVVGSITENINKYKVICTKSTVPIGTNKKLKTLLVDAIGKNTLFDIVSNPEFLREGSALSDFFNNNPIVLGSDSDKALQIMENLYKPYLDNGTTLIKTDFTSAETIKYAWNTYSTIKIAYVNQLSHLCNTVKADIATVVQGMSFSEKLLPIASVKPGPGIGGSCLPKDTAALIAMCKKFEVDISLVSAACQANEEHKKKILKDFFDLLDNVVAKKKIAVLGLSFKANTDDIRFSPATYILKELLNAGAEVYAYDPKAMNNMRQLIPEVHYCSSTEEALAAADALLLITDWDEFKHINIEHVAQIMAHKVIMDTRNIFDPKMLTKLHFNFKNLGYKPLDFEYFVC